MCSVQYPGDESQVQWPSLPFEPEPLPWPEGNPVAAQDNESTPSPPSYSVILKKHIPTVITAEERKNFLSNICGDALNDDDFEHRRGKYEWCLVTKNRSKTAVLPTSINKKSPETLASVKTPTFIGMIKFVPADINGDALKRIIPNCEKADQCGKTRSFKLYFSSHQYLNHAMKNPP